MRDSLDVFQRNFEDNNNRQNEAFDENSFGFDNKFAGNMKNPHNFDDGNENEENFKRPNNINLKQPKPPKEKNEEEEGENDFEKFKGNFSNFYRGYTPDDYSKRKYPQAQRILKAYENIKGDLVKLDQEKERKIKQLIDFLFFYYINLFS